MINRAVYATAFVLVIAFAVVFLLPRCGGRAVHIVYVLPDDFRGIVKLQGNQPDGISPQKTNGTLVLVIPPSGVLRLQGLLPVREWHVPSAHYQNGTIIPIFEPRLPIPSDTIAFRDVGNKGENEVWSVVGTKRDVSEAQERMDGFKYP